VFVVCACVRSLYIYSGADSANTQDTLVDLSAVITDGDTADQSTQSLRATDKKSPHGRTTTSHHDTLVNRMQKQKRMAVIRKTSMRQRSIMLDANDEGLDNILPLANIIRA
jgi:hypothetical protein